MKKTYLIGIAALIIIAFGIYSFVNNRQDSALPGVEMKEGEITWLTINQAEMAVKKQPKLILIDMYTDWCGWCKIMDKKTFTDPEVIQYINEHFYAVKFNAEQQEPVTFNGEQFKYVPAGRRGINTLAYTLLNGRLGFPSYVYLDENLKKVGLTAGFKEPDPYLQELQRIVAQADRN